MKEKSRDFAWRELFIVEPRPELRTDQHTHGVGEARIQYY